MWRSSESGAVENQNQKTGPRGQCGEAIHVTDNNDHERGQAYCNRCSAKIVIILTVSGGNTLRCRGARSLGRLRIRIRRPGHMGSMGRPSM